MPLSVIGCKQGVCESREAGPLGSAALFREQTLFQSRSVGSVNLAEVEESGRPSAHLEIGVVGTQSSRPRSRKQQLVLLKERISFKSTSCAFLWSK